MGAEEEENRGERGERMIKMEGARRKREDCEYSSLKEDHWGEEEIP